MEGGRKRDIKTRESRSQGDYTVLIPLLKQLKRPKTQLSLSLSLSPLVSFSSYVSRSSPLLLPPFLPPLQTSPVSPPLSLSLSMYFIFNSFSFCIYIPSSRRPFPSSLSLCSCRLCQQRCLQTLIDDGCRRLPLCPAFLFLTKILSLSPPLPLPLSLPKLFQLFFLFKKKKKQQQKKKTADVKVNRPPAGSQGLFHLSTTNTC